MTDMAGQLKQPIRFDQAYSDETNLAGQTLPDRNLAELINCFTQPTLIFKSPTLIATVNMKEKPARRTAQCTQAHDDTDTQSWQPIRLIIGIAPQGAKPHINRLTTNPNHRRPACPHPQPHSQAQHHTINPSRLITG